VTRVGTTTIHLDLEGSPDDVRTTLTAPESPELTEGDLASMLVTGRTLEHAGEGGEQIAATWMMSSLAGLVHEGLADLITFGPPPGAGPLILSEEADPIARLSFGIPVTERLSVTYSMALDSTERRLWILDYRVARNFWIRAIQENANDYGFGISQRLNFDIRRRAAAEGVPQRRDQLITSISIAGLPPQPAQQLRVRQGDRYNYWDIQDEAARIRENLVDAGYLSAVVDVETRIEEGAAQDAVTVAYTVTAGVRSVIVWRGDDPGRSIRNDVESAWDGRVPEEFLLGNLARVVRTRLQAERYFGAEVTAFAEEADDGAATRSIVFEVTEGPRGEEVVLAFEGNDLLSDEELAAALPRTRAQEFFRLLERPSELERGIRLRYAAAGHLDATAGVAETDFDPVTGILHVRIRIDEGSLVRVEEVDFGDGLSIDRTRLAESFGVAPGDRVDFPEIQAGQSRLRALYRSEGFSEVKVRAALDRTVEGVSVALQIEEGIRARIGEIRVVGSPRTNPSVILNEVTFHSGDPIRITDFQRTQKRLYDLGIFRSADVRPDPGQQGREIQDILIQVIERSDVDLSYGFRYNFIQSEQSVSLESEPRASGLEATARVNFINPFARGSTLGFSMFYQNNHQLFRATLRLPQFFRRRLVTEFIVDTENETYLGREGLPTLSAKGTGITFQQTKKLTDSRTDKLSLQWNFRYAKFRADRLDNEGGVELIDTYRPRFGVSLIEDRRDSFANPTRGRFWNLTFQAVPQIWGSDVGYIRIYGQVFLYVPLPKSIVWASGLRAGTLAGDQDVLLMDDRFQAGGANSVRGYKQNTLGPAVFFPNPEGQPTWLYIGGQAVTVINQELRFPIWRIIHGGIYWDAGNVWGNPKEFSFTDLRHTIGAGVRIVLPFGALRFDYAEPLNPCTDEERALTPISPCAADTVRFHFSFGYAF
jgi:outer membrane protein assembly complex protein YaeT